MIADFMIMADIDDGSQILLDYADYADFRASISNGFNDYIDF